MNLNMSIAEWNAWWNGLDRVKRMEHLQRQASARGEGVQKPLSLEAQTTRDRFVQEGTR